MVTAKNALRVCQLVNSKLNKAPYKLSEYKKSNPPEAANLDILLRDAIIDIGEALKNLSTTNKEIDKLIGFLKIFRAKKSELESA